MHTIKFYGTVVKIKVGTLYYLCNKKIYYKYISFLDKLNAFLKNFNNDNARNGKAKTVENRMTNDNLYLMDNNSMYNHDNEYKLNERLNKMMNDLRNNSSISKSIWINLRNESIDLICTHSSKEFLEKFIKLLKVMDPLLIEDNYNFFLFINQLLDWRENNLKNVDFLVEALSDLFVNPPKNETLSHQVKNITQVSAHFIYFFLKRIINYHILY